MSAIIKTLDTLITTRGEEVQAWLDARNAEVSPFFYGSIDLRHSGPKLVPVDMNIFPAGWNNISPAARTRAAEYLKRCFARRTPPVKKVLILPESHTRNLYYLDNIAALKGIFEDAGTEVQLGGVGEEMTERLELTSASGHALVIEPVRLREEGGKCPVLETHSGFQPDFIVVNNDFSDGPPEILKRCTKQPVVPPVGMGWYRRRKWVHFESYAAIVDQFGAEFGIDPWLISAVYHRCGKINFKEQTGVECLALGVEKVLHRVRQKYAEYGITDEPYVYIKADAGTYGMGIMTARSGDEIYEMNKKIRNKMHTTKGGVTNSEVVIQEGIPTIDQVDGHPAEPMLYMIDGKPVGGAFRVNDGRDALNSLNAPGMRFTRMCDEEEDSLSDAVKVNCCNFGVYGLITQLASIAAVREAYEVYDI